MKVVFEIKFLPMKPIYDTMLKLGNSNWEQEKNYEFYSNELIELHNKGIHICIGLLEEF